MRRMAPVMHALRQGMQRERVVVRPPDEALQFARKTYRYLRIAIVSMVVALLASVVLQSLDAQSWLGSLSAYYYSPVHAIFIGAMVMIGICLVAIRGTTDPEDIALNIAGLCAPIVAFVPTAFPDEPAHKDLFENNLPIDAMQWNNVLALVAAAGFALVLAFAISSRGKASALQGAFTTSTKVGFGVAVAAIGLLIVVHAVWGAQGTHNVSAALLIVCLWFVATINSVRRRRDASGSRSWGYLLRVGLSGSALGVGITLAAVGLVRLVSGDGWVVLAAGTVVVVGIGLFSRQAAISWFRPPDGERVGLEPWYFAIAVIMVAGGPALGLWPGAFEHRTLWLELAEMIPFGLFWILQTIESWHPSTDDLIAAV